MNDRSDDRYVIFFYANPGWETINYREELEVLQDRMNLKVVHVLEEPPEDWDGEVGFVTKEILDRHLPENRDDLQYFICGPIPMIVMVKKALKALGLPMQQVHTEKFEMA